MFQMELSDTALGRLINQVSIELGVMVPLQDRTALLSDVKYMVGIKLQVLQQVDAALTEVSDIEESDSDCEAIEIDSGSDYKDSCISIWEADVRSKLKECGTTVTAAKTESVADSGKESEAGSGKESATESGKESVADSDKESATESGKESAAESGKESVADSGKESVAESGKESVAESGNESVAGSGKESATDIREEFATDVDIDYAKAYSRFKLKKVSGVRHSGAIHIKHMYFSAECDTDKTAKGSGSGESSGVCTADVKTKYGRKYKNVSCKGVQHAAKSVRDLNEMVEKKALRKILGTNTSAVRRKKPGPVLLLSGAPVESPAELFDNRPFKERFPSRSNVDQKIDKSNAVSQSQTDNVDVEEITGDGSIDYTIEDYDPEKALAQIEKYSSVMRENITDLDTEKQPPTDKVSVEENTKDCSTVTVEQTTDSTRGRQSDMGVSNVVKSQGTFMSGRGIDAQCHQSGSKSCQKDGELTNIESMPAISEAEHSQSGSEVESRVYPEKTLLQIEEYSSVTRENLMDTERQSQTDKVSVEENTEDCSTVTVEQTTDSTRGRQSDMGVSNVVKSQGTFMSGRGIDVECHQSGSKSCQKDGELTNIEIMPTISEAENSQSDSEVESSVDPEKALLQIEDYSSATRENLMDLDTERQSQTDTVGAEENTEDCCTVTPEHTADVDNSLDSNMQTLSKESSSDELTDVIEIMSAMSGAENLQRGSEVGSSVESTNAMLDSAKETDKEQSGSMNDLRKRTVDAESEYLKIRKGQIYCDIKATVERAMFQAGKLKTSENTGAAFYHDDGTKEVLTKASCDRIKRKMLADMGSAVISAVKETEGLGANLKMRQRYSHIKLIRNGVIRVGKIVMRNLRDILYGKSMSLKKLAKSQGMAGENVNEMVFLFKDTLKKEMEERKDQFKKMMMTNTMTDETFTNMGKKEMEERKDQFKKMMKTNTMADETFSNMGKKEMEARKDPFKKMIETNRMADERFFNMGQKEELRLRVINDTEQALSKLSARRKTKFKLERIIDDQPKRSGKILSSTGESMDVCCEEEKKGNEMQSEQQQQKIYTVDKANIQLPSGPGIEVVPAPLTQTTNKTPKPQIWIIDKAMPDGPGIDVEVFPTPLAQTTNTTSKPKRRVQNEHMNLEVTTPLTQTTNTTPKPNRRVQNEYMNSEVTKTQMDVLKDLASESRKKVFDRTATLKEILINRHYAGMNSVISNQRKVIKKSACVLERKWDVIVSIMYQLASREYKNFLSDVSTMIVDLKRHCPGWKTMEIDFRRCPHTVKTVVACLNIDIEKRLQILDSELLSYYNRLEEVTEKCFPTDSSTKVYVKWLKEEITVEKQIFYDLFKRILDLRVVMDKSSFADVTVSGEGSSDQKSAATGMSKETIAPILMHLPDKEIMAQRHNMKLAVANELEGVGEVNETDGTRRTKKETSEKILRKVGCETINAIINREKKMKKILLRKEILQITELKEEKRVLNELDLRWRRFGMALVITCPLFHSKTFVEERIEKMKNLDVTLMYHYNYLTDKLEAATDECTVSNLFYLSWLKEEIVRQKGSLYAISNLMLELKSHSAREEMTRVAVSEQVCLTVKSTDQVQSSTDKTVSVVIVSDSSEDEPPTKRVKIGNLLYEVISNPGGNVRPGGDAEPQKGGVNSNNATANSMRQIKILQAPTTAIPPVGFESMADQSVTPPITMDSMACTIDQQAVSGPDRSTQVKIAEAKQNHDKKLHGCGACSLSCMSESHLKKHLRTHLMGLTYQCYLCNLSFTKDITRNRHMQLHTIGEEGSPYQCYVCQNYFWFEYAVRNHFRLCHSASAKSKIDLTLAKKHLAIAALSREKENYLHDNTATAGGNEIPMMKAMPSANVHSQAKSKIPAKSKSSQQLNNPITPPVVPTSVPVKHIVMQTVPVSAQAGGVSSAQPVVRLISVPEASVSSLQPDALETPQIMIQRDGESGNNGVTIKQEPEDIGSDGPQILNVFSMKDAENEVGLENNSGTDSDVDMKNCSLAEDVHYKIEMNIDSDSDELNDAVDIKTEKEESQVSAEQASVNNESGCSSNKTITMVSGNLSVNSASSSNEIIVKLKSIKKEKQPDIQAEYVVKKEEQPDILAEYVVKKEEQPDILAEYVVGGDNKTNFQPVSKPAVQIPRKYSAAEVLEHPEKFPELTGVSVKLKDIVKN